MNILSIVLIIYFFGLLLYVWFIDKKIIDLQNDFQYHCHQITFMQATIENNVQTLSNIIESCANCKNRMENSIYNVSKQGNETAKDLSELEDKIFMYLKSERKKQHEGV